MKKNSFFYTNQNNINQSLNIYYPESSEFDVFIYFHAGGLETGDKAEAEEFASYLAKNNIMTISVNYRMYPNAKFPEYVEDCALAVKWVMSNISKYGNPKRYFIGGSSAGAYLSMMLCFDEHYFQDLEVDCRRIEGYFFYSGQPTTHYNILKERGIDSRRVIVDSAAPLFYVSETKNYPKLLFAVSDRDMENRAEQNQLMVSTIKHLQGHLDNVQYLMLEGGHCECLIKKEQNGDSSLGVIINEFINE